MEIKFLGAAGIVTGSCHMLTVNGRKYLLDCGMFQGTKETTKLNFVPFDFDARKIEAVILSHAHIDHSGLIPKLCREGFRGAVHCTKATKDLCSIMLEDSADIQERETVYDNKRLEREGMPLRKPLYTKKDAKDCMKLLRAYDYNREITAGPGIKVVFRDAGHIIGSAIVEVFAEEEGVRKKIVFSGDLGKPDSPIVKDPSFIDDADFVIMESTYGSRVHEEVKQRRQMLLDIVSETFKKGGKLMIPAFAVERTQEIISTLNEFAEKGLMPKQSVFLDSPLAVKATRVFLNHPECYDREFAAMLDSGDNPFTFPSLKYIINVNESKKLNTYKEPCIIIAGSGMCNGGRIKHHLINHMGEPNSNILFVGYQGAGTLGRRIREGAKRVRIYGDWYTVNAGVKAIGGFSSHADRNTLIAWARNFKTKPTIFIVHGEPRESGYLASEISKFNRDVHIARMKQTVRL